jgi:hypothetical protein
MSRLLVIVVGLATLTGFAAACSSSASAPLTPTPVSSALPDGSTLKVTAPVPSSPTNDQVITGAPTLTASAATQVYGGGNAALQYRYQVFNAAGTMVQDSGLMNALSYTVTVGLQGNVRHTWRVRAEYKGSVGPWSASASFKTAIPFNMADATMLDNPPDVPYWDETTKITFADTSEYIIVDFDKRQSGDKWPESGFGTGGIQYTLGMCFNLGGQWYCSAAIQFWDGRELTAGGAAADVGRNWYYDARWGPMAGHQPDWGETVGLFVAQGNLRDSGKTSIRERSNVLLLPFGGGYQTNSVGVLPLFKKK